MSNIRVLLAEDHSLVRQAVANTLALQPDIDVVGEVGCGGSVLLKEVEDKMPDVLLLDAHMPGGRVIDAARNIHRNWPDVAILVLSQYKRREYVIGLLDAGAMGYVLKDDAMDMLVQAIHAVVKGVEWLSPRVREFYKTVRNQQQPDFKLTSREQDVLLLLAKGKTNLQISEELVLSNQTVKNYVGRIKKKLNLDTRADFVLYAVQHQLIEPLPPSEEEDQEPPGS